MRLVLDKVDYAYGRGRNVVSGVSLIVEPGTSVALVGPSGSGKSTVLALSGRVINPTNGRVTHEHRSDERPVVGWVLQSTNALPRRSVLDNVVLGGHSAGLPRRQALSESTELLEKMGLGGYCARAAGTLSGGELQRVVVARALLGEPPLVLADEPTGQLDSHNTNLVLDALFGVRPAATILLVATHDLAVAARCDIQLSIIDGSIAA